MRDTLSSQIGPFAAIPVALLDRTTYSPAIHLYAVLARYANQEGCSWPTRAELAAKTGQSVRHVARALEELRRVRAIVTRWRRNHAGRVTGSEYILTNLTLSTKATGVPRTPPTSCVLKDARGKQDTTVKDTGVPHTQLSVLDPKRVRTDHAEASEGHVPDQAPVPGRVFTGGSTARVRSKKTIRDRHTAHYLCTPDHCVTLDRYEKDRQRIRVAGLNPDEFDLLAWYTDAVAEMVREGTPEPGLWLYKRLSDDIHAEVA